MHRRRIHHTLTVRSRPVGVIESYHLRKRRLLIPLLILAATVLIIVGCRELARSRTIQLFGTLIHRVDITEPVIAITFDDGPTRQYTSEIIGVLAARKVQATFFVTGSELTADPETGKQLVAAGHELGNHTFSHERMVLKSSDFIRDEVEKTDAAIRAAGHTGESTSGRHSVTS